ncbi:MAG: hypothetical protein NDJ90_01175 [Oligoflexia bacterium]|nr:hypothetical protein [Oligoflexia bacterium]
MFHRYLVPTFAILIASQAALAQGPCDTLLERLAANWDTRDARIDQVFACGPEFEGLKGRIKPVDACVALYRLSGDPEFQLVAYHDAANGLSVDRAIVRGNWASGWESSGSYLWGDVKTYLDIEQVDLELRITVSRETARDMLFGPPQRVFKAYETVCPIPALGR